MLNHFSHVQLFATARTVAYQAPLSMGFSRQESMYLTSPALAGGFVTTSAPWEGPLSELT